MAADIRCSAPPWKYASAYSCFNWELFDHLPYSPDLAAIDYHLFTYQKNWLGSQIFNNNEELMEFMAEFTGGRLV
jgi:hypothetical protein